MRKISFIVILLLVFTVLFTISACGTEEEQSTIEDPVTEEPVAEEPLKIAYSSVGDPNPWFVGFADDLEKAANARGYIFEVAHAEASVQKQISDVEDLVVKNPDILVLGPIDMEGSAPALEIAKEAGVPVMLVNRAVVGVAGEDYISLLSSDFEFVGAEQARLIEEAFPASFEKIKVLELHGTPGGGNTIGLSKGFRDWIEANDSRIEIVGAQLGDYNRAQALKTMENVIQSGLEFDAIFGHFDEEAIGAITALDNSGIPVGSDPEAGEIIIVGNGGTVDGLKAIQAGKYYGLITVSPYYGEQTLDMIEAYFAGEEIPGFTKVEDFQITGENIDEYMWFGF